jgi:hypothetical protein
MYNILDDVLVGTVLLASMGYAVMAMGPRGLRRRMLAASGGVVGSLPKSLGLTRLAEKLKLAADLKPAGACGGCDNCGTEKSSTPSASSSEIKIPVGKIGRRG